MDSSNQNRDFAPLLCRWLGTMVSEPVSHTYIANILAIACRRLLNGGRFPNALADWENERARMPFCIGADDWSTIKAARSGFWHFEGEDLVVDFYSVSHEQSLLARSRGGRKGALRRWGREKLKTTENKCVNSKAHSMTDGINKEISPNGDISNNPSPLGAGGAFDDEEIPRTPQATPEEIERIFGEVLTHERTR